MKQGARDPLKFGINIFRAIIMKNSGIFSGKNYVKFGILLIFHTYFRAKMSYPPKLTELLRLCTGPNHLRASMHFPALRFGPSFSWSRIF